jgi:hypothetical protein
MASGFVLPLPLLPPPAESPLVGVFCFLAELLSSQAVVSACLLCRRRGSCTARLGKVVGGPGPSLSRQCPGALPAGVRSALPSTGTRGGCGLGRPRLACGNPSPSAMGCSRACGRPPCRHRPCSVFLVAPAVSAFSILSMGASPSLWSGRGCRPRTASFLSGPPSSWNLPTAGSQTWSPLRFQFLSRVLGMFCASSD